MLYKALNKAIVPALSKVIGLNPRGSRGPLDFGITRARATSWVRAGIRQSALSNGELIANAEDVATSGPAQLWAIIDGAANEIAADSASWPSAFTSGSATITDQVGSSSTFTHVIEGDRCFDGYSSLTTDAVSYSASLDMVSNTIDADRPMFFHFEAAAEITVGAGQTGAYFSTWTDPGTNQGVRVGPGSAGGSGVGVAVIKNVMVVKGTTERFPCTEAGSAQGASYPKDVATDAGVFDGGASGRTLVVSRLDWTTCEITSQVTTAPTSGDFVRDGATDGNAIYNTAFSNAPISAAQEQDLVDLLESELVGFCAVNDEKGLLTWGDSLTAAAYPSLLASLMAAAGDGVTLSNKGIGGQTSTSIAARQGGVVTELTLTGDQIDAVGTTAVTARNVSPLTSSGQQTIDGVLVGVDGTLNRLAGDDYTFTRAVDGSDVPCPAMSDFLVETGEDRSQLSIIWVGKNNQNQAATVTSDAQAMVAFLDGAPKQYLIVSVTNGGDEGIGTQEYDDIEATNAALLAAFPDNYVDLREFLVSLYDPEAPQDVIDFGLDTVPDSLRVDNIHLTTEGYQFVANFLYAQLQFRDYTPGGESLLLVDGQPSFTNGEINYIT